MIVEEVRSSMFVEASRSLGEKIRAGVTKMGNAADVRPSTGATAGERKGMQGL